MATRTVVYGETTLEITDDSLTLAQIKESMANIFPEIRNAEAVVEGDTIRFEVRAGTKGATRTVVYGETTLEITDDSLTLAQIKESMANIFPEIRNAEAVVDGSTIRFEVRAGTKGDA